jgi:hypothetical protein
MVDGTADIAGAFQYVGKRVFQSVGQPIHDGVEILPRVGELLRESLRAYDGTIEPRRDAVTLNVRNLPLRLGRKLLRPRD